MQKHLEIYPLKTYLHQSCYWKTYFLSNSSTSSKGLEDKTADSRRKRESVWNKREKFCLVSFGNPDKPSVTVEESFKNLIYTSKLGMNIPYTNTDQTLYSCFKTKTNSHGLNEQKQSMCTLQFTVCFYIHTLFKSHR